MDIDNDRAARYAFLETLRGFVDQLGDQFRSRKNTVVYHMIRHKFEVRQIVIFLMIIIGV